MPNQFTDVTTTGYGGRIINIIIGIGIVGLLAGIFYFSRNNSFRPSEPVMPSTLQHKNKPYLRTFFLTK
jgi:hypothetical protein